MCDDFCGSIDEFERVELMVVYARDVNFSGVDEYYIGVAAEYTSVGSPVH